MNVCTLTPVNGQLKVAGEVFFTRHLAFDRGTHALIIKHPVIGEFPIIAGDGLELEFLDLEVPTAIRQLQRNNGWERMTATELLTLLTLTQP